MKNKESYFYRQSELMLSLIPFVAREKCFALKGGTALNFFVRDMPRLSVDIDLTYLPLENRETSLALISAALKRIAQSIQKFYPNITVKESIRNGRLAKITAIRSDGYPVTIEPNEIIRGTLFASKEQSVSPKVEEVFEISTAMQVCSLEDLYGGKLCAALDRQHPRDLFDVKILLENEGITDRIRQAFLVYLASHDRPMHELLNPIFKEGREIYEQEFFGMTSTPVAYEELIQARSKCLKDIKSNLSEKERLFLLSIKQGNPQWEFINIPNINLLPALQWKLINIKKMSQQKHKLNLDKLKYVLEL